MIRFIEWRRRQVHEGIRSLIVYIVIARKKKFECSWFWKKRGESLFSAGAPTYRYMYTYFGYTHPAPAPLHSSSATAPRSDLHDDLMRGWPSDPAISAVVFFFFGGGAEEDPQFVAAFHLAERERVESEEGEAGEEEAVGFVHRWSIDEGDALCRRPQTRKQKKNTYIHTVTLIHTHIHTLTYIWPARVRTTVHKRRMLMRADTIVKKKKKTSKNKNGKTANSCVGVACDFCEDFLWPSDTHIADDGPEKRSRTSHTPWPVSCGLYYNINEKRSEFFVYIVSFERWWWSEPTKQKQNSCDFLRGRGECDWDSYNTWEMGGF